MDKPQPTIAEIGEERRAKLFRPDTTRVIKPRDPAELADILFRAEDEPCE